MPNSILVAFATTYGSTQEVAERIAATLREQGAKVELMPVKQVRSLDGYHAVILGAPLYMFRWSKDALGFLSKQRTALAQKPLAIFALGPVNNVEKEFQGAREQLDKELTKFPWLHPAAIEIFGGRMDPTKFRFPHNLIPAMNKMPVSDIRDWAAIAAWASKMATQFQAAA